MSDSQPDDVRVFDATPYLKLVIDKEGRWFQNGAEIIHRQVYLQFNKCLERTDDGGYRVRLGQEICGVEVEDAPFVVRRVLEDGDSGLVIELNDDTREPFQPERFWIGPDNVPYCKVKSEVFHARFSRPAYYTLAENIVQGNDEKQFFFEFGGERTPVASKDDSSGGSTSGTPA